VFFIFIQYHIPVRGYFYENTRYPMLRIKGVARLRFTVNHVRVNQAFAFWPGQPYMQQGKKQEE